MRVTKEEEKRFFLAGDLGVSYGAVNDAMKAAFTLWYNSNYLGEPKALGFGAEGS